MLDRAIGIVGIAIAIVFQFAPHWFPRMPEWAVLSGMYFGVLLFGLAIGLVWADKRNLRGASAGKTPTSIRLQMNPGSSVAIEMQNVWYWYALTFVREKHFNKKKEVVKDVPGHLLFIVFDSPVEMKQPIVECAGAVLPFYEEKSRSNRHLLIDFTDAVSGKVVNVRVAT